MQQDAEAKQDKEGVKVWTKNKEQSSERKRWLRKMK